MKVSKKGGLVNMSDLIVPSGDFFPEPDEGELFKLTAVHLGKKPGLYLYSSGNWIDFHDTSLLEEKQFVHTVVAAKASTTLFSFGNTAPTITQGIEIATLAITPTSTQSRLHITGALNVDTSNKARVVGVSVWRGTTLIGVCVSGVHEAFGGTSLSINLVDEPSTVAAVTYKFRAFANGSGTWYVGQVLNSTMAGALAKQVISIKEYV